MAGSSQGVSLGVNLPIVEQDIGVLVDDTVLEPARVTALNNEATAVDQAQQGSADPGVQLLSGFALFRRVSNIFVNHEQRLNALGNNMIMIDSKESRRRGVQG